MLTGLPQIRDELGFSTAGLPWVLLALALLVSAVFIARMPPLRRARSLHPARSTHPEGAS